MDSLTLYGSPGVPEMDLQLDETELELLKMNTNNPLYNPNQYADLETMGLDESRAFYMENDGDIVSGPIGGPLPWPRDCLRSDRKFRAL